jgi:hypothetical protein
MTVGPKRYALERRARDLVVTEEGKIGVTELAVFDHADYELALGFVHFLNGDFAEAERCGSSGWRIVAEPLRAVSD